MILLIRHGETALNVTRVVQPADTPLSPNGLEQARRLGARLRGMSEISVEHVIASDLPRAAATADAIVRATGATIEHSALLQERNFGDVRGKPYADVGPDIFALEYVPPGGESWPEFDRRVREAWRFCVARAAAHARNIAIVTHGLVCRSIAEQFLSFPAGQSAPQRWGNTSLTLCAKVAPHEVALLNCVAHLGPEGDDRAAPSGL